MLGWLKSLMCKSGSNVQISVSNIRISGNSTNISFGGNSINFKDLMERHFDDIRTESAESFDTIKINSGCPVKILSSNTMDVEVHFFGDAYFKGNVDFNVSQEGNKLNITVKLDGVFQNTDLQLNISIPKSKKFKKISVETTCDEIEFLDESISAEKLRISTSSGDSNVKGDFDDIKINSSSGEIDVYSKYVKNLKIETSSGDIDIGGSFKNIGIESSSGKISLDVSSVELLKIETSSGDTNIRGDLKKIETKSSFGKITLDTTSVESLNVETSSGDANINGDFKDIYIISTHGKITANIYAKSDVQISIETTSADAEFNFENVRQVSTTGSTSSGEISNNLPVKSDGYIANIRYKTTFGDITIN